MSIPYSFFLILALLRVCTNSAILFTRRKFNNPRIFLLNGEPIVIMFALLQI